MKSATRACRAVSLVCLAAVLSIPAQGAVLTATQSFSVTVNLTPVCTVSAPATLSLNYTDGQATDATSSSAFTATCTSGVAYTLALSGTGLTAPSSGQTLYSATAAGLNYTLEIQDTGAGNAAVDPAAEITAASAAPKNFRVFGSIAASQSGTCAASDAVSSTVNTCAVVSASRTITLTY